MRQSDTLCFKTSSRILDEADRRIETHKRFVKKIEDAKVTSVQKYNKLQEEYARCRRKIVKYLTDHIIIMRTGRRK